MVLMDLMIIMRVIILMILIVMVFIGQKSEFDKLDLLMDIQIHNGDSSFGIPVISFHVIEHHHPIPFHPTK